MIRKCDCIWNSDRLPVNAKNQTDDDNNKHGDDDDNDIENNNNGD